MGEISGSLEWHMQALQRADQENADLRAKLDDSIHETDLRDEKLAELGAKLEQAEAHDLRHSGDLLAAEIRAWRLEKEVADLRAALSDLMVWAAANSPDKTADQQYAEWRVRHAAVLNSGSLEGRDG